MCSSGWATWGGYYQAIYIAGAEPACGQLLHSSKSGLSRCINILPLNGEADRDRQTDRHTDRPDSWLTMASHSAPYFSPY